MIIYHKISEQKSIAELNDENFILGTVQDAIDLIAETGSKVPEPILSASQPFKLR